MARRRLTPAQPARRSSDTALEPTSALADPRAIVPSGAARAGPAPPIAQVAGEAAEAAALREITESLATARATGRMVIDVEIGEIAPGYLVRDRVTLDTDEIERLKISIRENGQRTPAEITPLPKDRADPDGVSPYTWGLVSGWRRLRAVSELFAETGEIRFSTLRALVRPPEDAAQSYVAMVEENEIRVGLSYYERARVVAEAVARGVFPDQSTALRDLFATASRAKRSKIASFIDIHEQLGDVLTFPAEIPERLGLSVVAQLKMGGGARVRAALADARPKNAKAELALLERLVRPPSRSPAQKAPARETLGPGVDMKLSDGRDGATTVTLSGPGVNAALVARLRTLLG